MELRDYARVLRGRWKIFLGCVLAGLLVAGISLAVMPRTYASRAEIFVAPRVGSTGADLNQGTNFVLSRVKSYVQIITSEVVLQPVIDQLGLDETPRELAQDIEAEVVGDTSLITVRVSNSSPEQAARIANAIVQKFVAVAPTLEPTDSDGRRQSVVQVTVVQSAAPALDPYSPSATLNLALGLMAGLALGVAGAVLAEYADRRVRSERHLTLVTDAPVIGRIPLVKNVEGGLPTFHSEAVRDLRTNLEFIGGPAHSARVLVLTSSRPGEGKSSVAIALAESLAEVGKKVLLLEADLRRPVLAERLNLEGAAGLSSILIGAAELADVTQPWGDHGLEIVVAGAVPPNPSELLASAAMAGLVAETEAGYDVVLVDSPPLLPVTDSAILATLGGGAVVVAEGGATAVTRGELSESLGKLHAVDAPVRGIIMNKLATSGVDALRTTRYGYATDDS